jgi:protein arginine N-methyltransferase 3
MHSQTHAHFDLQELATPEVHSGNQSVGSSGDDVDDQGWDDWAETVPQICQSLFEDKHFSSVKEALAYDKATYDFDLYGTYARLCSWFCYTSKFSSPNVLLALDLHQRIRLVNFIRKNVLFSSL